jgi:D-3-phosphoglycerate dehydrogenase/(S)-sulfolactate dehydrogenase
MPTVLITADPLWHADGRHVSLLRDAGFEIGFPPHVPLTGEDETIAALNGIVAVLAGSEPYSDRVLSAAPGLKIVSRCGVGYDRIDVRAAERLGVAVAITPEGNHQAVAEHTLALVLALARSIVTNDRDARSGRWRGPVLIPVRGKTLGLVGLGRIGRSVARRALAFGMNVLACDPYAEPGFAIQHGIELTDRGSLLARSDFVSLHLPLNDDTRGTFDRAELKLMKQGAFLINTSRGGLIVEADLVDALRSGHLRGAGLDVLADEPPRPENPLLALENVILSPHVAANDIQAIKDMADGAAENIVAWFQGRASPDAFILRGRS